MARWTVEDGDELLVIESVDGRITLSSHQGPVFTTLSTDKIRDLRLKLGLAIGDAQAST